MQNSCIPGVALALGLVVSCGTGEGKIETAQPIAHPEIDLGDASLSWGEPVEVANLKLWPIRGAAEAGANDRPEYLTLDEALETGVATVVETGSVQELELVNDSDRPILLLGGEVLQGGKQDRIIARDTEVPPGAREPLASFCVEAGRWHARDGDALEGRSFLSAKLIVANSVRNAAQVSSSQGAVWSNVSILNNANAVISPTSTYLASGADPQIQEKVAVRAAAVIEHLGSFEDAVGFVAAVDSGEEGEQVAAEIFGDPRLFLAYREKLVRSYCLDSITSENARRNGVKIPALLPGNQSSFGITELGNQGFDPNPRGTPLRPELLRPPLTVGTGTIDPPGEIVLPPARRIEAATPGLGHLHRTIYQAKPSEGADR